MFGIVSYEYVFNSFDKKYPYTYVLKHCKTKKTFYELGVSKSFFQKNVNDIKLHPFRL